MLSLLDQLLRDLFIATVPGITTDAQVGFQPPNDDWHTYVSNLGTQLALNVYLIDLREDRKLRMNDRVRTVQNGTVSETAASIKMDCHYLISAWSPAKPAPGVEPALDEHSLLFSVVATLSGQQFLNPSRVYTVGSPKLNAWPETYRDREMQMMYLPVEGFGQFAEFWQTMGSDRPWKPAVHVVVTLPVPQPTFVMGGIVTTVLADVVLIVPTVLADVVLEDGNGKPELLVTIGGVVQDHSGAPVAGAWVRLETPPVAPAVIGEPIQITSTDDQGHFLFDRLGRDNYVIRARAPGFGEATLSTAVPSPTGSYIVELP